MSMERDDRRSRLQRLIDRVIDRLLDIIDPWFTRDVFVDLSRVNRQMLADAEEWTDRERLTGTTTTTATPITAAERRRRWRHAQKV